MSRRVIAGGGVRAVRSTNALSPASACLVGCRGSSGIRRNASSRAAVTPLGRSQSTRDRGLRFLEDFVRYKHVYGMAKVPAGACRRADGKAVRLISPYRHAVSHGLTSLQVHLGTCICANVNRTSAWKNMMFASRRSSVLDAGSKKGPVSPREVGERQSRSPQRCICCGRGP
jgi:hypothetical protein